MKSYNLKSLVIITGVLILSFVSSIKVKGYFLRRIQGVSITEGEQIYLPFVSKPYPEYNFPSCPTLDMPVGLKEIGAKPNSGFYWPYFVYKPTKINSTHVLVVPNNTGTHHDDFCYHRQKAYDEMLWRFVPLAKNLGTPLIVPIFPRFAETDGIVWPQYLGRGSLEEYWQNQYPLISRVDLQLIAMVDDFRTGSGSNVWDQKILMWGYSASGIFVSRFVALHPNRIQAATIGGHGWTISPVPEWDELELPFPYGAGDLLDLIGAPVNLSDFSKVPMFIYMGAEDTNGWGLPWYIGMGRNNREYYEEQFEIKFGSSASSLLTSAQLIYDSLNCNAKFILYPGTGHEITKKMDEDVFNFLNSHK